LELNIHFMFSSVNTSESSAANNPPPLWAAHDTERVNMMLLEADFFKCSHYVLHILGSSTAAPQPTTTTTTTPPTPSPTANNPLAGFCNGKRECDQFISCVAKKIVYIRDCPAGLYYNAKLDKCDWKRNVNCPGKYTCVTKIELSWVHDEYILNKCAC